ncbi:hypothetical protein Tco_0231634 [Tanacetum coccineum]
MADQDTPPPTITAMKIPIIKKGEYDIWSMRMRQYICHTDHNLWDIIVNEDLEDEATPSGEQSSPPVPKTAIQLAARMNQERIKSIFLLTIPDEYLLKFHNVPDAKSLWAAIKSRFGGNEESKKMQKNVLKHQFENFEDINQKFLRSLLPSWSQIALIMRNKPDIDDLYNNLRVYEDKLKGSSGSNSAFQNLDFLSSENTNSTNEVSTTSGDFGVSTAGGINQVPSTPSGYVDCQSKEALMAQDGLGGYNWSNDFEVEPVNYALMAISSSNSSSSFDSEMSTHDKNGLGFGTQMDDLSNKSETNSENSLTVFEVRSRNPLTPRADISFAGLDEYDFRNKIIESKIAETNKTVGTTNEATIVKPKSVNETVVSKSKINRDEVIIVDWTLDDEDDVCAVKTVSSVKPNMTQAVRSQADKSGQTSQKQGIGFKKSPEPGLRIWSILGRGSNVSTARSVNTVRPVSTARPLTLKITQSNSVIRPNHLRLDIVRPKASNTPIKRFYFTQPVYRPKDLKPDVKTFGVKNMTTVGTRAVVSKSKVENVLKKAKWVWRPKMNYQDHVYKYNGSYMLKKFEYGNPEILLQDHAVVDSGCSSHMTDNKAYLSDYEYFNGGLS